MLQTMPEQNPPLNKLKNSILDALVESMDLTQLNRLDHNEATRAIHEIALEVLAHKRVAIPIREQEMLIEDICNDVLGLGPLERLLARDDITDIMINGPENCYVERAGRIEPELVRFADAEQLLNVCQKIVSMAGRRVDEQSPICDARLPDGSRVNVILPPLAVDGPVLTIRKFQRQRLTLDDLVAHGTISREGAQLLEEIGRSRLNVVVSGGTGSGKTTLLNCLTGRVNEGERIVTCEDAAELQLQQPHVVRLETRMPNLEGEGTISMRELVRNSLRMRPDRIIVGEVRGAEAFDLLQAMNTGHDGSMGTLHANSPRDALRRLESMVLTGGHGLTSNVIRQMIASAVDIIIHTARLPDGTRKITHVSRLGDLKDGEFELHDLLTFEANERTPDGRVSGRHRLTGTLKTEPHLRTLRGSFDPLASPSVAGNTPAAQEVSHV